MPKGNGLIPEQAKQALRDILEDQELYTFEKDLAMVHPVWKNERWMKTLRRNYETLRAYNGSNRVYLYWAKDDLYLTRKQIEKFGATLKDQSEPGYVILGFFPFIKKKGETEEAFKKRTQYRKFYSKVYHVFGVSGVDGLEPKALPEDKENKRIETVEEFIHRLAGSFNLKIEEAGNSAIIMGDIITIPKLEHFTSSEYYYMTLFKKIILWAGMKNKKLYEAEVNDDWSKASLAAEIAASALCHTFKIDVLPDSREYVDTWIQKMKDDISILPIATKRAEEILELLK
jgi:antirestriction protein ArdC